jgi:CsoR family transcriptional regulator, copper-sensing transcriptional repressor
MDTSTELGAGAAATTQGAPEHAGHAGEHDHGAHHQHGYAADKARIRARLSRIEGQVRGIGRMVDDDTYCIDILTQVSAATRALENVALLLLEDHLDHCVRDAARRGGPEADAKLAEATAAIARLVRS